jgi:hypothetical protein
LPISELCIAELPPSPTQGASRGRRPVMHLDR